MYTSGSTGKPKGILHGHRVLAAYTPSINLFFNMALEDADAVYWSPSDWACVGGLLDMLFPAWMAGRPIATSLERFTADYGYAFMSRHKVTHTFLAPTAIKRLTQRDDPHAVYNLALRVICTVGEAPPCSRAAPDPWVGLIRGIRSCWWMRMGSKCLCRRARRGCHAAGLAHAVSELFQQRPKTEDMNLGDPLPRRAG